jgi:hypothetical protein
MTTYYAFLKNSPTGLPFAQDTDIWVLIERAFSMHPRLAPEIRISSKNNAVQAIGTWDHPLPVILGQDCEWTYGHDPDDAVATVDYWTPPPGIDPRAPHWKPWHWQVSLGGQITLGAARTLAEAMRFAYEDAVDHGLLKPHVPDASSQKPIDPANPRDVRIVPLDAELTVSAHGEEIATVQARLLVVVVDGVISAIDLQRGQEIASLPAPLQGDGLRVGARVDECPALKRVMLG